MKLKHWQGYGTVNAKKISAKQSGQYAILTVEVTGFHEYGLVCHDNYTLYRWLVSRFAKNCPDDRHICNVQILEESDSKAVYEIIYRPAEETK